ncbi:MAG: GIN domain-containing protein, partial [Rubrivivax sp.]
MTTVTVPACAAPARQAAAAQAVASCATRLLRAGGRLGGAAQNLSVSVAGSGDAWLSELEAEDVRVSVAGSGDARVNARQRLRASVAGSGDVRYRGSAR